MPEETPATSWATWLYRLIHSHEWAELRRRYLEGLTADAIRGQWSADRVAELARDMQGLNAFALWCENELTRKAGLIDGRANRYKERGGAARAASPTAGEGDGAGGSGRNGGRR